MSIEFIIFYMMVVSGIVCAFPIYKLDLKFHHKVFATLFWPIIIGMLIVHMMSMIDENENNI